jgi:hypothetical protein
MSVSRTQRVRCDGADVASRRHLRRRQKSDARRRGGDNSTCPFAQCELARRLLARSDSTVGACPSVPRLATNAGQISPRTFIFRISSLNLLDGQTAQPPISVVRVVAMADTVQVKKAEGVRRAEFTHQRFEPPPPELGEAWQTHLVTHRKTSSSKITGFSTRAIEGGRMLRAAAMKRSSVVTRTSQRPCSADPK